MTPEAARALLDVPADAGPDVIENAFRARSRMMHPDRFAGRPESEVRLATLDFQRLETARRVLLDGDARGGRETNGPPHVGLDIRITHTVTAELLLNGGVERIATDHGVRVIRVPARTRAGATVRAAGMGAPGSGPASKFGDLYVVLRAPETPTPDVEPSRLSESPRPRGAAVGWILGIAVVLVVLLAFATARNWTKTEVPEHPETFHSEDFRTGSFVVVDDGIAPCRVGQDWTDCVNAHVEEYNGSCVGRQLTASSGTLCSAYSKMIDEMQADDQPGWVVETLGSYGRLTATEEIGTRQVSNNDYRPAVTRDVVCFLGFLGECSS